MPDPEQSIPHEPRGMTLADLVVLIVGVGLACSLPWVWFIPQIMAIHGPGSRFFAWLVLAYEGLGKACIALTPVVLVRRFRYGGVARPAEFLLALCSLSTLAMAVEHLSVF